MKQIKYKKIKVGDYIKASVVNEKGWTEDWYITYFQVKYLSPSSKDVLELWTNFWIDFDKRNRFLKIYKQEGSLDKGYSFYKLTEEEFMKKLGKYIIVGNLE